MGSDTLPLDLSLIDVIETDAYPAMVTREEANLILARVEKNRQEKRDRPPKEYPLTHHLWRDVCGCGSHAAQGRYHCGCTRLGKPLCRALASVMQRLMESAVVDGMRDCLRRPDVNYALALPDYNAKHGPRLQIARRLRSR